MFNLEQALTPLVRGAVIRVLHDAMAKKITLNRDTLLGAVELEAITGFDNVGMDNLTFHTELMDIYNKVRGDGNLNGWFSELLHNPFKAISHGVQHFFHEVGSVVHDGVSHLAKAIKKVAPIALGAVALFYGAPYIMEAGGWVAESAMTAGEWIAKKAGFNFAQKAILGGTKSSAPSGGLSIPATAYAAPITPVSQVTSVPSFLSTVGNTAKSVVNDVIQSKIRQAIMSKIYGSNGTASPNQQAAYNQIRTNPEYPPTGPAYPIVAGPIASEMIRQGTGINMSSPQSQQILQNQGAMINKSAAFNNKRLLIYGGLGLATLAVTVMKK